MLNNKLAAVDARIEELHQLRGELTALLDRSARLDPSDCRADEICHILNR